MEKCAHRHTTDRWGLEPSALMPSLVGLSEFVMLSPSTKSCYSFRLINSSSFPILHIPENRDIFSEMLQLFPENIVPFQITASNLQTQNLLIL